MRVFAPTHYGAEFACRADGAIRVVLRMMNFATTVGSSRADEEERKEGKCDGVNRVSPVLKRVEPNGVLSGCRVASFLHNTLCLLAFPRPFSSTVCLFQLSTALKAFSKCIFRKGNRRTV